MIKEEGDKNREVHYDDKSWELRSCFGGFKNVIFLHLFSEKYLRISNKSNKKLKINI